jgi:hypothetical protein
MHTKPQLRDWKVFASGDNCVKISIDPDLCLDGVSIRILGSERNLISTIIPESTEIEFCEYTGRPMFVELHTPEGNSVHFVEGSGKDFYIPPN